MDITVVIVMGPAGAGKSTVGSALARAMGWRFADADDHHSAGNRARMRLGHALTDEERHPWLVTLAALVREAIEAGTPLVLACSALRRRYRRALAPPDAAPRVRFAYLDAPASVLATRLAARAGHFAGPGLLASQLATIEEPDATEPAEVLTLDATQPVDVLVEAIRGELRRASTIRGD